MAEKYIATPTKTREILQAHHFSIKKSLGQNFIIDANILKNIIHKSSIDESVGVIEIGPGIGGLTEQLALAADRVLAYEIDDRLIPVLDTTLGDYDNIHIINRDFLQSDITRDINTYFKANQSIHIIANLPYYITTPILLKLVQDRLPVDRITVMIQKEVAERIAADPGTKNYGSLSIAIAYYAEPRIIMDVSKNVFMPRPNVESTVLQLIKRTEPPVEVTDESSFFTLVQAAFRARRKTLSNNLYHFLKDKLTKENITEMLAQSEIDGTRRGESLDMEEFARLANTFFERWK